MLSQTLLIFLSLIFPIFVVAIPAPIEAPMAKDVKLPDFLHNITNHLIWTSIRKIGETSSNKEADILELIKGTFLDPEVIAATQASSTNPIAQSVECDTSAQSPRYADSLYLVSIVMPRSEVEYGPVRNPGGTCTEHASWWSSQFGICSSYPTWMTWRTFGTFAYIVTTSCVQQHVALVSGGRNVWSDGQDVRVY
ncbi:hypothetical protein HOY80DRAFT_990735 [Tuber brumale]|nr:hypothetical protein HOY80DRAFT_990735 [Tuber brumale]